MRTSSRIILAATTVAVTAVTALAPVPAQAASLTSLTEGFDDISLLAPAGWSRQNLSSPLGTTNWFQGNMGVFPAQAGPVDSYIGANYNNTSGAGVISNWLLTPELLVTNGSELSFWTRTAPSSAFPDRLQVRMSTSGASTDVGGTATSVGDFSTLLLDINPSLQLDGYPASWTQYTVTVSGLPAATTGRLAFRYYVTDGGSDGANSNYIGIDTVAYSANQSGLTASYSAGAVRSRWQAVTGALGYTAELTTRSPGAAPITKRTRTDAERQSWRVNLRPGTRYTVCVRARTVGPTIDLGCASGQVSPVRAKAKRPASTLPSGRGAR